MRRLLITLVLALLPAFPAGAAPPLLVAVAANFRATLEEINALYAGAGGAPVQLSSASTGVLTNQALYGAPFHLLLAADADAPALLARRGIAGKRRPAGATGKGLAGHWRGIRVRRRIRVRWLGRGLRGGRFRRACATRATTTAAGQQQGQQNVAASPAHQVHGAIDRFDDAAAEMATARGTRAHLESAPAKDRARPGMGS